MKNKEIREKALWITEEIGESIAELEAAVEFIHYDPDCITEEDLHFLKDVLQKVTSATEAAQYAAKTGLPR